MAEAEVEEKKTEGEILKVGTPEWSIFSPKIGEVLEFEDPGLEGSSGEEVWCAMVITEIVDVSLNGFKVFGRFIGSSNEELSKEHSVNINRRGQGVHVCAGDPCFLEDEKIMCHCRKVRMWSLESFNASYVKSWGQFVLKEIREKGLGTKPNRRSKEGVPGLSAKPKAAKPVEKERAEDGKKEEGKKKRKRKPDDAAEAPDGEKGERKDGKVDRPFLAKKLGQLKDALLKKGGTEPIEVEDGAEQPLMDLASPGGTSDSAVEKRRKRRRKREVVEPRLNTGDHLNPKRSLLAIKDVGHEEDTRGGTWKEKKSDFQRKEVVKDPEEQLLAMAAQQQGRAARGRRKKRREDRDGKRREKDRDRRESRRGKKNRRKKRESRKRKKKGRGDPSGSSGDSGSSDYTTSSGEESSSNRSSSSSSLLAPLQKKSKVLHMDFQSHRYIRSLKLNFLNINRNPNRTYQEKTTDKKNRKHFTLAPFFVCWNCIDAKCLTTNLLLLVDLNP